MKPVIVGEVPSPSATRPVQPLFPFPARSAGGRLWRMTGLSRPEYLEAFHRINLWPTQHVPEEISIPEANRWAAWNLISSRLLDGRAVVLLGKRVWVAFGGCEDREPLIWYIGGVPAFRPACVALMPDLNSEWHDNEHQAGAAVNFMKLLAEGDYPDWSEE